jgi:hypothetical protein
MMTPRNRGGLSAPDQVEQAEDDQRNNDDIDQAEPIEALEQSCQFAHTLPSNLGE